MLLWGCSSSNDANSQASNRSIDSKAEAATNYGTSDDTAPNGSEPVPERGEGGGKRVYGSQNAVVQAGQLTAGEWDDLAAWESFGNLLNSNEGDTSLRHWSFLGFNRLEVAVTSNGRAVTDAQVQIKGQKKGPLWEARTNTEGRAYLFVNLFDRDNDNNERENQFTVEVKAGQQSKTFNAVSIPGQGTLKLDLGPGAEELSNKVDVMFVVDTTGSMEDELNYLEAELKDVITRVGEQHANQLDVRVSTNFYRDNYDDYVVKPYAFTRDIDKAVDQIAKQKAQGGGDYPEAVEQALRDAVQEHDWSEEARARLLFLVLDAPPHTNSQIIDELHDLIEEAASLGIRIIPVASSGVDVETEYLMRFFAVATGGTYLFLTDDSGIGGDHLEPAAGEYEVKLLNDLLVEVINRYVQP